MSKPITKEAIKLVLSQLYEDRQIELSDTSWGFDYIDGDVEVPDLDETLSIHFPGALFSINKNLQNFFAKQD